MNWRRNAVMRCRILLLVRKSELVHGFLIRSVPTGRPGCDRKKGLAFELDFAP